MWTVEIALRGAGGEPVDLRRTIYSHGVADLPPMRATADARLLETTLAPDGYRPRTVRIHAGRRGYAAVDVVGPLPGPNVQEAVVACVRHVLSLDQDLSPFYARAAEDPALSWAAAGAGRMIRSPTVFEDVVKTICTTNVAWSATVKMVSALVANLGRPAPGAPPSGWEGRAFPSAEAMAARPERFYRDVVRAGYRALYLRDLARMVAGGEVDLEQLGHTGPGAPSDDEAYESLLALPGIGPYAAAHVLMVLGRHSRLVLDSWTRPTYAKLVSRKAVGDDAIRRRFRRYGPYAGLAFWLFLTRGWVSDEHPLPG
jgi:N-glycosylase/DNA lyase